MYEVQIFREQNALCWRVVNVKPRSVLRRNCSRVASGTRVARRLEATREEDELFHEGYWTGFQYVGRKYFLDAGRNENRSAASMNISWQCHTHRLPSLCKRQCISRRTSGKVSSLISSQQVGCELGYIDRLAFTYIRANRKSEEKKRGKVM